MQVSTPGSNKFQIIDSKLQNTLEINQNTFPLNAAPDVRK